jgi:hypothetical protein
LDIAKIIVIIALVVIFLVVMKYAVRLGCLFFLTVLVALVMYLWTAGNLRHIGNFFKKKSGDRAAAFLPAMGHDINGG